MTKNLHPIEKKLGKITLHQTKPESHSVNWEAVREIPVKDLANLNSPVAHNKRVRLIGYARPLTSDTIEIIKTKISPFGDEYDFLRINEFGDESHRVFGYRLKSANGIPRGYEGKIEAIVYTKSFRVKDVSVVEVHEARRVA